MHAMVSLCIHRGSDIVHVMVTCDGQFLHNCIHRGGPLFHVHFLSSYLLARADDVMNCSKIDQESLQRVGPGQKCERCSLSSSNLMDC